MDLKTLCELNGPSGNEQPVRKYILEEAKKLCEDVRIDRMGNVICKKKGKNPDAPHVALSAHMDEVGFIVWGHTEDGMLRIRPIGGIDPRVVVSKWVLVNGETPGIIGAKAIHLQTREDRQKLLNFSSLYIDIGAKNKEEAMEKAPLASYASFVSNYEEFGEGFVVSKALDDRVGCYNLLRILKNDYPCDISVCFVNQEEVGLRGSTTAAYLVDADIAVVLEGTACNDLGDTPENQHILTPGEGVAVSFMDRASIADRDLFNSMLNIAKEHNIKAQVKRGVTGGNDATSFQLARGGAKTIVLSVPCRYIHSPSSVCNLSDVDSQYALADAFLNTL
ncbi:MAG: M42 family metallopeptidase [Eubacteriales bacterium]|nr:M42 family metallopeptidase [Eubacteriales bacterium]